MARPTVYTDLLVKGTMTVEGGILAPRKAFGCVDVNEASGTATTHTVAKDDMREVIVVTFGDKENCVLTLSQPDGSDGKSVLIANTGSKTITVACGERTSTVAAGVTTTVPLRFS